MAVDIGALRKFQELWGPVLEALPAVMDAVAKQEDFERWLHKAQLDLDAANAKVQAAKDDVQKVRAKAAEDEAEMNARVKAALEAAERRSADAEEESRVRIKAAKERAAAAEQQAILQETAVKTAEAQVKTKIAEAQKSHDAVVVNLKAEVKALEDRKAAVEAAIEALKSKLG